MDYCHHGYVAVRGEVPIIGFLLFFASLVSAVGDQQECQSGNLKKKWGGDI